MSELAPHFKDIEALPPHNPDQGQVEADRWTNVKDLDNHNLSISEQEDHAWKDYHDNPPERESSSLKAEPTTKKNRVSREEARRIQAITELAGGYGASEEARQEATDYIDSRPSSEEDITDSKEEKAYEDMGVKELARELAKAELDDDKTSQSNITDVLFDKLDTVASKQSKNDESASKNFDDEGAKDPTDALLDRVMKYKDQVKTEIHNDEIRSRIDDEVATKWMTELKSQGVPDDILQKFPASFFYKDGDPEQTDDTPQEYLDWLEENPQTQPENTEDISQDDTQEIPVITGPEPKTKRGLWARVKQAFKKPPAVRFDGKNYKGERVTSKKIGDAIVDTRDRKYEGRHYAAIVATGALAVGAAYLMSKVGHDPGTTQTLLETRLGQSANIGAKLGETDPLADVVKSGLGTIEATTPNQLVHGAFDSLQSQGFDVSGLTPNAVDGIVRDMTAQGIDIQSGVGPGGIAHIVDVSQSTEWAKGHTDNYTASAEQAIPRGSIRQLIDIARQNGVRITPR